MLRKRTDIFDSYEGIPLDSPERRMIQTRNAQREENQAHFYIGTARPDQAPVQRGSTSASPPPALPESQTKYNNGTTTIGPFPPPKLFDLGDDDFISRMLADDPNCSTFDASFADVPQGMASSSSGESSLVNAPSESLSVRPESNEPSQNSSRSATADIASSWGVGDIRSDFNLSYRPGETASPSTNALTHLNAPPLQKASHTASVPQNLSPLNSNIVATRTLPHSPTSPIASYPSPSYQNCDPGANTSSASRKEDLLSGCVRRHPIHTAAQNGYTGIIELLLQSGCDINLKDGTGSTPLHISAAGGHNEVVRLLVNQSSDTIAIDNRGRTPIHLATRKGHTDCVELLLKLGS